MRLSFRPSGTSPRTMRWARPSTMAVLPTPGSPISTGLFLVRRASTWMTRRTSSSRPMTGSSLPRSASSVRSRPYFSSAWYLPSGFWSVTRCAPRTDSTAGTTASRVMPRARSSSAAGARPPSPAMARNRCSVLTNWSCMAVAAACACSSTSRRRGETPGLGAAVGLGPAAELVAHGRGDRRRRLAELLEQCRHDAAGLLDQRDEQVLGLDLGVRQRAGQPRRRHDRFLGLFGEGVEIHRRPLPRVVGGPLSDSGGSRPRSAS